MRFLPAHSAPHVQARVTVSHNIAPGRRQLGTEVQVGSTVTHLRAPAETTPPNQKTLDMWSNNSSRQKRRRAVFLLGVLLTILGSFSVVLGVAATAEFSWSMEHRLSAPIWGGLMIIATGSTTTYAIQKNKHRHLFYVLLGVSVAGVTVSFPQWILALSGLVSGGEFCSESFPNVNSNPQDIPKNYVAAKALHGVCLMLGFLETLVSFSLAILAGVGICDTGETSTSRLDRETRQSVRRSSTRRRSSARESSTTGIPARPAVVRLHLASGCRLFPPPYTEEPGAREPYTVETRIGPGARTSPPPYAEEPGPRTPYSRETHFGPRAHTSPQDATTQLGPRAPYSRETHFGPRAHTSPQDATTHLGPRAHTSPQDVTTHLGPRAHTSPQDVTTHLGPRAHTSPQDITTQDLPPPYQSREDLSHV
ncbi:Hypp3953 [Branchiostoma lanceolatum]|uniref:Hypp3953 protein n=1 Tax=Branchiostoma lanceolatum TaxID=7740 RepID=A0A8K0A507_BRALA|nr:Hypp3953 [Branchiostoma lanceolatum]